MKLQPTSVAVGALSVIALIAIFAYPYKDAIIYAINHRKQLSLVGDAVDLGSQIKGIFS